MSKSRNDFEYIIVGGDTVIVVEQQVRDFIRQGFKLQGGIGVSVSERGVYNYVQAMIKDEDSWLISGDDPGDEHASEAELLCAYKCPSCQKTLTFYTEGKRANFCPHCGKPINYYHMLLDVNLHNKGY